MTLWPVTARTPTTKSANMTATIAEVTMHRVVVIVVILFVVSTLKKQACKTCNWNFAAQRVKFFKSSDVTIPHWTMLL